MGANAPPVLEFGEDGRSTASDLVYGKGAGSTARTHLADVHHDASTHLAYLPLDANKKGAH